MSAAQKGTGLISRAVREALSTLVSPQMCEQLIERSLASYGLDQIPESGHQVGSWLEDSLRPAVEFAVGPDAADLMMAQLGPIAAYAAISSPKVAPLAPAPVPAPARPISSFPPVPDFEDEGDRPTGLRFDTAAEPNWEPEPDRSAVKLAPNRSNDSGPPTGLFQNARELTFSPLPPANANVRVGMQDDAVATLPPVRTVSESDRPTSLPPQGEIRPASDRPTSLPPQIVGRPMGATMVSDATENLPQVLTATNDQKDVVALRRYLSGTARVTHIADFVGLLDALEAPNLVEPIVLIDCQRPSVHIKSIASIGEDLPRGTTVVLWGADDATWQQIDRDRSPSCRWVRCSHEATTDDVGSLCSMLLG